MKPWIFSMTLALLPSFWALMAWLGGKHSEHRLVQQAPKFTYWASNILLLGFLLFVCLLALHAVESPPGALFKLHGVNSPILLMVLFIGVILLRFSRNYLFGEDCYPQFFRWMLLTMTAVVITLMANHLLLFWGGWVAISLSLHRLLLLYPERPRAVLAAHKKFILARIAELCVLSAFVLLYLNTGSFFIDEVLATLNSASVNIATNAQIQAAAILLCVAALIKCAQLPVHGWLINVVESATPVSALLHAGIINLGGYLLILFASLISQVVAAQWVLAVAAGTSTLLASLIMLTRISVKVRLAWSTCAQMGLMLLECALGLYELALLHLLAHSLYKAYAFLNAGNAVYEYLGQQLTPLRQPRWNDWTNATLIAGTAVLAAIWLSGWQGPLSPWLLIGLALISFIAHRASDDVLHFYWAVASAIGLLLSYVLGKSVAGVWLQGSGAEAPLSAMDAVVMSFFLILFAATQALRHARHLPVVQRMSAMLFAGLYIDEWFTRTTLQLWPVALPERTSSQKNHPAAITQLERQV